MIISTFTNTNQLTKFLSATNLTTSSTSTVEIELYMVSLARVFEGTVEQIDYPTYRYIVKTNNPATIITTATVIDSTGENGRLSVGDENYYVVESQHGLSLYNEFNGLVDCADDTIDFSNLTINSISEFPADYQWGRLRIISRNRPLAESWITAEVTYSTLTNLVIMDSGINFDHTEFQDVTSTEDLYSLTHFNGNFRDTTGHGTNVAGAAAGINLGIHQHLNLINCKIGSSDYLPNALDISNALDAVYDRFVSEPTTPMVVNMSWTFPKNNYLEHKIQNMIDAGIGIVCAAGNYGMDVSILTPAGMTNVITVAASDQDDIGAGFNNFSIYDQSIISSYGQNIDIFAPGVSCLAAGIESTNSYVIASGSSISAGYVSGCVASIMSLIPNTYYLDAKRILIDYSTKGALLLDFDKFTFDQNRLAYLLSSENASALNSSTYYVGYLSQEITEILGNINQIASVSRYVHTTGDEIVYSITCDTEELQQELDNCVSIDSDGNFKITSPNVEWDPDEKIRLFSFKFNMNSTLITFKSPTLIFFASNPDVTESLTGDISTALESMDSQSFFAVWRRGQIK